MKRNLDSLIEEVTKDEEEDVPTKRLNVDLPKPLHRDFKAACTRQDQSMSEAITRFVQAYVAEHL